MTRKDFISHLYSKVFMPLAYLILFVIGFIFIKDTAGSLSDPWTSLAYLALFLIGFFLITGFISLTLNSFWKSLPEKARQNLTRLNTIIGYIAFPFALFLLYKLWDQNRFSAILLTAFYIFPYLIEKYKTLKNIKPT